MYSDKNLIHILTVLEAVEKLELYSQGFSDAHSFWMTENQLYFNASTNLLIAIGEESMKMDAGLKGIFPDIPWREIGAMRNRLAHNYRGADPDILWQVVKRELSPLKKALIKMLD